MDDLRDYFNSEQIRLESISAEHRKDANRIVSDLSKHLILTSTVFIALSSSILSITNISKNLPVLDKFFLIIGLSLLVLSIFMGLLQYLLDYLFFKKQTDTMENIIKLIVNNGVDNEENYKEKVNNILEKNKLESHNFPTILQIVFLLFGIISFLFVIWNFLF